MININKNTTAIQHGGNLETAIKKYGFDKDQWIDLSTGISPWSWPVQVSDEDVWRKLPPSNEELIIAAAGYYRIDHNKVIATPGSQMAIRLLPQLFKPSTVAVPALGYQEHAASWQLANHTVLRYQSTSELFDLLKSHQAEHAVVINPNNPSCEILDPKTINNIAAQVPGAMIIDEAFIDFYENSSPTEKDGAMIQSAVKNLTNNMIVLRSIGKFFGLAGLRLGFAIGDHPKVAQLNTLLQPWSISHASMIIGTQALADNVWQQQQHLRIKNQTKAFLPILTALISNELSNLDQKEYEVKSCGLFNTVLIDKSLGPDVLIELHHKLAQQAIWTRLFNPNDDTAWLRFSLPADLHVIEQRLKQNNLSSQESK